jgi:hypothetical protein
MQNFTVTIPHTGATPKTLPADLAKVPTNIVTRLAQIQFQARVRSAVNNAVSLELDKAETAAREAHDKAQTEAKAKDAKHKVVKFDSKAFKAAFVTTVDPIAKANEAIAALYAGELRERGQSGASKLLDKTVKSFMVAALMAKGKKQREANTIIGESAMDYIERTARKRAGEGEGADERYKAEYAKLEAQYIAPARAILGDEPEDEPEGDEEDAEGGDEPETADDLV